MLIRRWLSATALLAAGWCVVVAVGCAAGTTEAKAEKSAKLPATASDVAATIGGKTITMQEVDAKAMDMDPKLRQQFYDARKKALDQLIADQLIEKAAKERGVTAQQLIDEEVTKKIQPVSDDDVSKFYNENQSRMGGRTLDQVQSQIRAYLEAQSRQAVNASFIGDLRKKAGVKILLEPPRIDVEVAGNAPSKGPENAPIQITELSDFQCPFCGRAEPTLSQIESTYGDKVRITWVDLPLSIHKNAQGAAEAARCAQEQGKFWEYHDKLFENQRALTVDDLKKYAADLGLDTKKFDECVDSGKYRQTVLADAQRAAKLGVSGTPAFYVNGRFLSGAQPFEAFKQIIDDELERKGG